MFGLVDKEESLVQCDPYNFEVLLEGNGLPVCSLFRKSAWAEVGGYKRLPGYADWEFWISLGEAGHKGELVDKALFLYRKHGQSMIDSSKRRHEELFAEIRKLHPGLYDLHRLEQILINRGNHIYRLEFRLEKSEREICELRSTKTALMRAPRAVIRRLKPSFWMTACRCDRYRELKRGLKESLGIKESPGYVSIILPDYNRTDKLRSAVQSVLDQKCVNYELLIVLDGSPEKTVKTAMEFAGHPRVRIFLIDENTGNACLPRNVGIKEAAYDLIAFQDSDDLIHPNKLAFLPGLLGGADLVHGNSIIRYGTGKTEMTTPYQANMKELLSANFVGINTVVARKSALLAVGGFKPGMRYLEDYELWCRLMHAGYKFKYVKGVFGIYIIHPGNLEKSFKPDEEKWKSLLLEEYTRIPDRMALPGYRTLSLRGAN